MQQKIKQITENYIAKLPNNKESYYLEDLKNSGFPPFLIRRIQLALFQKLLQSVSKPQTQWADGQDESVAKSWHQLMNSLKNTVRVPSDQSETLIEQAVTDIIHVLVQPRQNIPELLFEKKETLSVDQLSERIKWLVVYPHFGHVLTRYVQRKGENELNHRQCENIVTQVDEKITRNYTPFQWAEMLNPLFELMDSSVEADLFRLFFEDRQMEQMAKEFSDVDLELNRDQFIDILIKGRKREDMVEESDEAVDEPQIASVETEEDHIKNELPYSQDAGENDGQETISFDIDSDGENESESDELADARTDGTKAESNQELSDSYTDQETKTEAGRPLGEKQDQSDVNSGINQTTRQEGESASLNDIFSENSEPEDGRQTQDNETLQDQINGSSTQEVRNDDVPIWQRFADTGETSESEQLNESLEEQVIPDEQNDLREYLQNEEDYFIESLFDGSKQNYLETLEDISLQDSWKEAYQLVNQDVFEPNEINIYSEAAVDFTDRLQNYYHKMQ